MTIWDWLFNPSGLTAHGFCLSWAPGLIATHVGSDAVIGLAYLSIPLALASFTAQRKDIEYGWIAYLFMAFIVACGTTHLMSIITLWSPAYGIEGVIKVVTAVLSIATAGILWPLIPKLVALPSSANLKHLNSRLAATIEEQERMAELLRQSEAQIRSSNVELERRVAERTAQLVAANAKLTDTLAQRDILLREVYHRVKNNLQIVDSILVMQSGRLSDPDANAALDGLRSRIYTLGLVHNQLMGSENLRTFDVAPFLQELSGNIVEGSAGKDISVSVRAIPLDVDLDFAIPLGLLVTELVTNAVKHAFPDGKGKISVALDRLDDGTVALVVSDNCKGYGSPEPQPSAYKGSLGMNIIRGLVAQLKATLIVENSNGTRAEIRVAAPVLA